MADQWIALLVGGIFGATAALAIRYLIEDIRISKAVLEDLKELRNKRANELPDIVETPSENAGLSEPSVNIDGTFDLVQFEHTFINEKKRMVTTISSQDLANRIDTVSNMITLEIRHD